VTKKLRELFVRPRFWGLWVIPIVVLLVLFLMDPDGGLSLAVWLASFAKAFVVTACVHLIRKMFFDYPAADMERLFERAKSTPEGSGLALIALAIIIAATMLLFAGTARADVRTTIPAGAVIYAPVLKAERLRFWPDHPAPGMLGALVEHESCLSLTHSRCWNPKARLKSAREEGAGFGQITRAYRADGSVRFDALAELRGRHPALGEWSWSNVYDRPDLQLRGVVLKAREEFVFFRRLVGDDVASLHFADAAYNGGRGGVQKERQACHLSKSCDPKQWFGNVAEHCMKARVALYGTRSACDINRFHVLDVCVIRPAKYKGLV
jgi:hypothetical protein